MMKTALFGVLATTVAIGLSAGQIEEKAKELVARTLKDIHSQRIAHAWESFSDSSKDEFRRALLEELTETRNATKPPPESEKKPIVPDNPIQSQEMRKKLEEESRRPFWMNRLRRYGFLDELERVSQMDNETFWATFIGECYLVDKEARDSRANAKPQVWPKTDPNIPPYRIDGVAVTGDRFFVVMHAPLDSAEALFAKLNPGGGVYWPRTRGVEAPEVAMVWSGIIENGEPKLNVPDKFLAQIEAKAYAMKMRNAKR